MTNNVIVRMNNNALKHRRFGFTLDVHETLLALTLHVYFLRIWLIFFYQYCSTHCGVYRSFVIWWDTSSTSSMGI